MMRLILSVIFIKLCSGLYLNDTEYSRMPPVFQMDLYEDCILKPNGTFCLAQFVLVSDTQSDLLDMIKEYSSNKNTRYNHTLMRHGICVSDRCHKENTMDLEMSIESCLNETYWEKYNLKTKVLLPLKCNTDIMEPFVFNAGNIIALLILTIIIIMNFVGSLYHACLRNSKGNRFLICFSIKENFSKLRNCYKNLDEDEKRLRCFHGLRMLTILCVIYIHSIMITRVFPENPRFTEMMYDDLIYYIIFNGTVLVQTFFIMAGFLLAYKIEKLAERQTLKWYLIPKGIFFTWLRLTPSYALVILFTITWLGHLGSGPHWQAAMMTEVEWCQDGWLSNLFYFNNYVNSNKCMFHSWYIATNIQLMILGYFVCFFARSASAKKWTLAILLVIGTVLPAAHTFYQDLEAVLFISPELATTYFINPVYNNVYSRAHTNLPDFVMGVALGHYTYYIQKEKIDVVKFQKYKFLFILALPMVIVLLLVGFFFQTASTVSVYARALYAGLIKPIYGILLCITIFASIFKIENTWRPFLEWHVWQVPSKLTYMVYLIHLIVIRFIVGNNTMVYTNTLLNQIFASFGVAVIVFLVSVPLWVCFEGPITELCKVTFINNKVNRNETSYENNNNTFTTEEASENK